MPYLPTKDAVRQKLDSILDRLAIHVNGGIAGPQSKDMSGAVAENRRTPTVLLPPFIRNCLKPQPLPRIGASLIWMQQKGARTGDTSEVPPNCALRSDFEVHKITGHFRYEYTALFRKLTSRGDAAATFCRVFGVGWGRTCTTLRDIGFSVDALKRNERARGLADILVGHRFSEAGWSATTMYRLRVPCLCPNSVEGQGPGRKAVAGADW